MSIGEKNPKEALNVNGNIRVTGWVDSVDISELKKQVDKHRSRYNSFKNLNYDFVDVGNTWTKLNTGDTSNIFRKRFDETYVEVFVNSRVMVETLTGTGILFQVRLSGQEPTWETRGSMIKASSDYYLSFMGVFERLPAGSYDVEIWTQVPNSGNATKVLFDPGGYNGGIVVKESW
ncbi:MAG: hypothetical protein Q9P90_05605 [candidate division KSB1 bacterium]|nr:hypothetical protein [candidate division KSB1 bacterium]